MIQDLRLEAKAIQSRFYGDCKVALQSITRVSLYFPHGHFSERVSGLQIWRRPLLPIIDGHVEVMNTKSRDDLPDQMSDDPMSLMGALEEHLAAYFEVIQDILDEAEKNC